MPNDYDWKRRNYKGEEHYGSASEFQLFKAQVDVEQAQLRLAILKRQNELRKDFNFHRDRFRAAISKYRVYSNFSFYSTIAQFTEELDALFERAWLWQDNQFLAQDVDDLLIYVEREYQSFKYEQELLARDRDRVNSEIREISAFFVSQLRPFLSEKDQSIQRLIEHERARFRAQVHTSESLLDTSRLSEFIRECLERISSAIALLKSEASSPELDADVLRLFSDIDWDEEVKRNKKRNDPDKKDDSDQEENK